MVSRKDVVVISFGVLIALGVIAGTLVWANHTTNLSTARNQAFFDVLDYLATEGYVVPFGNIPRVSAGYFGHDVTHRTYSWLNGLEIDYGTVNAFLNDFLANSNGSLYHDDYGCVGRHYAYLVVWFIDSNGVIVSMYGFQGMS
jgi:hypothetical protein